jgi:hypothetical protein
MKPLKPIHWVIDRFENGYGVLKHSDEELRIPRIQLPEAAKEGDVLTAEFYFVKDEKRRRENIARALLEEIIGKQ